MADEQDLHQIEYRHHQTNDLSPFATSMTSRESLAGWDSRIRAWVRHPHAEMLSESACYQVFPNGQAALAWRYWDERAASRGDGTLGRPLVSRVLIGLASVLIPEVALALCRAGLAADWAGWLPGQVPDGEGLPTVSGRMLADLTREMTRELDEESAAQKGLQAVVAAALAEPGAPLAISMHDALIRVPLRKCVQCPLLWGLRKVTGPLLGPVGRGWSFSTFELPLGKTDPTSLPGIVFRETQDGVKAPPSRWRREAKVRPFDEQALGDAVSYAGMIEQAGWLVAEYQKRGGDGLTQFIGEHGGASGPFAVRIGKVSDALRRLHAADGVPPRRPPAEVTGGEPAEVTGGEAAASGPQRDAPCAEEPALAGTASAGPGEINAEDPQAELAPSTAIVGPAPAPAPGPGPGPGPEAGPEPAGPRPEVSSSGALPAGIRPPLADTPADGIPRVEQSAADGSWFTASDPGRVGGGRAGDRDRPDADDTVPAADAAQPAANWYRSPVDSLAPSREGQVAPPLSLSDPDAAVDRQPAWGGTWNAPRKNQETASSLLKRLELLGEDQALFQSILDSVYEVTLTSDERGKSWDVICHRDWYENICRNNNNFRSRDLAKIFGIIVIPEIADQTSSQAVAKWAAEAPPPMIKGLLEAAGQAGEEMWNSVMGILEPTLAYRWTVDHYIQECWDEGRVVRSNAELGRGDGNRGLFGLRRRPARRP